MVKARSLDGLLATRLLFSETKTCIIAYYSPKDLRGSMGYQVKICFFSTKRHQPSSGQNPIVSRVASFLFNIKIHLDAFKIRSLFPSVICSILPVPVCKEQQFAFRNKEMRKQCFHFSFYQVKIFFSSIWRHQIPLHAKAAHSV